MSSKNDIDLVIVTLKVRSPLPVKVLGKKVFWQEATLMPDGSEIVGADATAARMPAKKKAKKVAT